MRRSVHINSSSRLFFASSTFLHFFDNCVWNCAEITKYFIEELFRLFSVKVSVCLFFFTSVVLSISLLFSVSLSFLLFLFLPLSARSSIPLSISVPICLLIYNALHISFSPSLTICLSLSRPLSLFLSLSLPLYSISVNAQSGRLLSAVKSGNVEEVLACLENGTDIESRGRVRYLTWPDLTWPDLIWSDLIWSDLMYSNFPWSGFT